MPVVVALAAITVVGACSGADAVDGARPPVAPPSVAPSPAAPTSVPPSVTPPVTPPAPTSSVPATSAPSTPVPSATVPATPPPPDGTSVRFSVLGDIGSTDDSDAVLTEIAARRDDFTLAVGDLSYDENGPEERWCGFVTQRVGTAYPFELVAGNHEEDGPDGDIDRFVQCLPNRLPGIVGEYGREWYVDQPAVGPVVRVVMISPSLDFGDGKWSYDAGTTHHAWVRDAVTGARDAGVPWVVVGMHKPCLTVGRYECAPGADLTTLLVETGVDLVVTGHEHLYQRTRPLGVGAGCPAVRPDRYTPACVAAPGTGGTTFVTVGTGGQDLRAIDTGDPERPYFEAFSGENHQPSFGSLDVVVTRDRLTATFDPVGAGTFTDQVVLTR